MVTPSNQSFLTPFLSASRLEKLATKQAEQWVNSPQQQEALLRLTNQIAQSNGLSPPTNIVILNDPTYNAFSTNLGEFYINKGVLDQAKPDEVAFLVAHEMAHLAKRDYKITELINIYLGTAGVVGMLMGSVGIAGCSLSACKAKPATLKAFIEAVEKKVHLLDKAMVAIGLMGFVAIKLRARLSYEMEGRADDNALRYLKQSGLPTTGYRQACVQFQKLENNLMRNPFNWGTFLLFRDHPPNVKRFQRLQQQEATLH